ncbi:MAG: hypothetical protein ACI4KF_08260 [Huintestinicola sp.]
MTNSELQNTILSIKKSCGKVYSNCFYNFNLTPEKEWETYRTEKTLFIVNEEYKVSRLWFYTCDPADIPAAARLLPDREFVLDIVGKDPELLLSELAAGGFEPAARMKRMSTGSIDGIFRSDSPLLKYMSDDRGTIATAEDAEDIYSTLWDIFDTRISHLPDMDSIYRSIAKGEFIIRREGKIISLLQAVKEPKRFYINQVYNCGSKENIHSILLNELRKYCDAGGKYMYAWVEESNIPSMKFHGKYGLSHDGLYNIVYVRK